MGQQDMLRQKLTQRLSKDPQGVIRTLKSAGVKLSQQEEAGISRGSLDQFSDAQLGERFNPKVLGMLGISSTEGGQTGSTQQAKGGANTPYNARENTKQQGGKPGQQKNENWGKKQKPQ